MKLSVTKLLTATLALTWLMSVPALAQSKSGSRDSGGSSKVEQSREPGVQKSRERAPSKSQGRDTNRSGAKSRR